MLDQAVGCHEGWSRFLAILVVALASTALAACGADVSPTAPAPIGAGGATLASEGSAVIDGQVVAAGSPSGSAPGTANVTVVIEGAATSDVTDVDGRFRLGEVPSGTVRLVFESSGMRAAAAVENIAADQHVQIKVEVQALSARILSDERSSVGEFQGTVATVDSASRSLTLGPGRAPIFTDENTRWDRTGDLFSFAELANAHAGGAPVAVEGRAVVTDAGILLATAIKAEVDGDQQAGLEFEGRVVSANAGAGLMTLESGRVLAVDGNTQWDPLGDLTSIEAVAAALPMNGTVRVEGTGTPQDDGSVLVSAIKAEVDEDDPVPAPVGELRLRIQPDEWRGEWANGSNSGSGGATLEGRIEGGAFRDVDSGTLLMTGPDGSVSPVSTQVKDERFQADFPKSQAIHIIDSVPHGGAATIVLTGALIDGTPLELSAVVSVRRDDETGKVLADAIDDVGDLIDDVGDLVDDGDLGAADGAMLIGRLQAALARLATGDADLAVDELRGFVAAVQGLVQAAGIGAKDGADLIEEATEIIGDLGAVG